MLCILRSLFVSLAFCSLPGCLDDPAECQTASDCGATTSTCAGCPDEPDAHCRIGTCVDVEEGAENIVGDLNLDRDIAAQVVSVVHVLAHVDGADDVLSCENVWDDANAAHVAARVNVLASGYKSIAGGSNHPDITFGRVPTGQVVLLVVATDANAGEGNVVAKGCSLNFNEGDILDVDP
ncbi:MAG: hypothetical protein GY822_22590 [Deltaproteobacteria bacterium]|nr:hypothetical protein [Deltaproteobacteria bacterium]